MRLFLLLLLFPFSLISQDILLEQDIKFKHESLRSFIIPNPENDHFNILQIDHKNINIQILDENFNITNSINIEINKINKEIFSSVLSVKSSFFELLNYKIKGGYLYLNLTTSPKPSNIIPSNTKKQYLTIKINIKTKKYTIHKIPFKLKKEKLLSCFLDNDQLYFFTILNKSSILKLYILKDHRLIDTKKFDLSKYSFGKMNNSNLFQAIRDYSYFNGTANNRDFKVPSLNGNKIGLNSKTYTRHKIYNSPKKLFLTEDFNKDFTRVISINLDDLSFTIDYFKYDLSSCNSKSIFRESNSFLADNTLYQVTVCNEAITCSITDLETKKIVQSFKSTRDKIIAKKKLKKLDKIDFPFFALQSEVASFSDKGILKHIARKRISISTYQIKNQITISIGGTIHSSSSISTVTNPQVYTGYTKYFESKVDSKTLQHLPTASEDAFSEINATIFKHTERNEFLYGKTIFPYQDGYLFGYYNKKKKKYYLKKFNS